MFQRMSEGGKFALFLVAVAIVGMVTGIVLDDNQPDAGVHQGIVSVTN